MSLRPAPGRPATAALAATCVAAAIWLIAAATPTRADAERNPRPTGYASVTKPDDRVVLAGGAVVSRGEAVKDLIVIGGDVSV